MYRTSFLNQLAKKEKIIASSIALAALFFSFFLTKGFSNSFEFSITLVVSILGIILCIVSLLRINKISAIQWYKKPDFYILFLCITLLAFGSTNLLFDNMIIEEEIWKLLIIFYGILFLTNFITFFSIFFYFEKKR